MRSRRALLAAVGTGMLGGCGFRPLYMPEGGGRSVAGGELAAIFVPVIAERNGQLLRQALQRRVEGSGTGVAKKYELIATLVSTTEGQAIQRDTSTTRLRVTATAPWTLRALNVERAVLAQGSSRVLDGFNVINQQFFALDLEGDAAARRIAESLADQIVASVAVFLRRRATEGA